jgi:DNA-binding MarR family transcriptional regulator
VLIRPKHGAVFANVDPEGTRASVLARRAGVGRPAMGELIDELQRLGYLERQPDPSDRRAKLVVPTPAAVEVARLVHDFNRRLEARLRRRLGVAAYESLRASLVSLAGRHDAQPRIR